MGPACPGVLLGPQGHSVWGLLVPVFFWGPRRKRMGPACPGVLPGPQVQSV